MTENSFYYYTNVDLTNKQNMSHLAGLGCCCFLFPFVLQITLIWKNY